MLASAVLDAMGDQAKDCVMPAVVIAIHLVGPVDVPEDDEDLLEIAGEFGEMQAEWASINTDSADSRSIRQIGRPRTLSTKWPYRYLRHTKSIRAVQVLHTW
jgi:hypothetical protein